MIVSLKWLREYVEIPLAVEELAHGLTMAGVEVEGVQERGGSLEGVITARVEAVGPHPGADRLSLCKVTDGREAFQVVCGAPNVRAGLVVPLALPGARLPSGVTLKEARIRGQLSKGMLCSQRELDLGEDASGIWILPSEAPLGIPLAEALDLEDVALELGVTPNRGDCLSMLGVAREVAAICRTRLNHPPLEVEEEGPPVETLSSVEIQDPQGCPRYAARVVEGVRIGPSPSWLARRLEAVGLRSINNIVDVTNFIMMEMGQPLHAFDYDRLREHRIVVRLAREGERFSTLDGVERALYDDTLMICDGAGPVAIAGVMGGLDSEITDGTTRVLIESACFNPRSIRRTGKKLGLRTESAFRFERSVDPEGTVRALDRAARLMREVGGGAVAQGRLDEYPGMAPRVEIPLRVDRTNRFLGTDLSQGEMSDLLESIELKVESVDHRRLRVKVPSFRPDLAREVDLMEEVARLAGYDRIPVTYPKGDVFAMPDDPHRRMREEIKDALQGFGYHELLTYSFISRKALDDLRLPPDDPRLKPVEILNPLSEEQAVMRTSLIPGLLQTLAYNFHRQNENPRLFELSKAFLPRCDESKDAKPAGGGKVEARGRETRDKGRANGDFLSPLAPRPSPHVFGFLPDERYFLVGAASGRRRAQTLYARDEEVDYTDVKGVVERLLDFFHPREVRFASEPLPPYMDPAAAACVLVQGENAGTLGRLHPKVAEGFDLKKEVWLFELDFEKLFAGRGEPPLFRSMARFPAVTRDLALVMDESVPVQDIVDFINEGKELFLRRIEVFDLYQSPRLGAGKKSVGYRLTYRAEDRSLTDEEINDIHANLTRKVMEAFNAVPR